MNAPRVEFDEKSRTAKFYNFTPQVLGSEPVGAVKEAIEQVNVTMIAQLQQRIDLLQSQLNSLQLELDSLNPGSVGLGSISQDEQGKILLNADSRVEGQLTVFPKLEVKNNYTGVFVYPWDEATKFSSRLDMWSEDDTRQYELSIFRDTFCSNAKVGVAFYRPNHTNTINAFIAGIGNSFISGGNFGLGTSTPAHKLDVVGSTRFNGNIGFFNKTPIAQQAGGAKTAAVAYGANEQGMIQTVYNALRNFGFLT